MHLDHKENTDMTTIQTIDTTRPPILTAPIEELVIDGTGGPTSPATKALDGEVIPPPSSATKNLTGIASSQKDKIEAIARQIDTDLDARADNAIKLGKNLIAVKTLMTNHGEFIPWVESRLPKISVRTAQNWMTAAATITAFPQLKALPPRDLYKFTGKTADEARKKAASRIDAGKTLTSEQIDAIVATAKGKPAKAATQKAAPAPKATTATKAAPEAKPNIPANIMTLASNTLSKLGVEKAKLLIEALNIEIAKIAGA
jgi:hypothetical protein